MRAEYRRGVGGEDGHKCSRSSVEKKEGESVNLTHDAVQFCCASEERGCMEQCVCGVSAILSCALPSIAE